MYGIYRNKCICQVSTAFLNNHKRPLHLAALTVRNSQTTRLVHCTGRFCLAKKGRWIRKPVKKTCRWHVFRAWFCREGANLHAKEGRALGYRTDRAPPSPTRKKTLSKDKVFFQLNPPLRVGEIALRAVKSASTAYVRNEFYFTFCVSRKFHSCYFSDEVGRSRILVLQSV